MKNFLHKFVYITIKKIIKDKYTGQDKTIYLYYTCAYVTEVSDKSISFTDKLHNNEPFFYKLSQIEDCKLSNKVDSDGNLIKRGFGDEN